MFVFKNGELIVRNGKVVKVVQGATHVVRPEYDRKRIEKPLKDYFDTLPHGAHGELPAAATTRSSTAGCGMRRALRRLIVQPTGARK